MIRSHLWQTSKCTLRYRIFVTDNVKCAVQITYIKTFFLNGPTFWKCWNSKFESISNSTDVTADGFANYYFSKAHTSKINRNAADLECRCLRDHYQGFPLTDEFNAQLVSSISAKLKHGKAADFNGLTAEHLTHCHPMSSTTSTLFNLILTC